MADIPELRTCRQKENKKCCGGAIWTNLNVTTVIKRNGHGARWMNIWHIKWKKKAILNKRSAEETKPILAIYDEASALRFCYIIACFKQANSRINLLYCGKSGDQEHFDFPFVSPSFL
ncbi:hypothetical protein T4D_15914 [Trichinella pseudospiralis]|uniref:Uncharacterized protein n=1 Tax=Trichinella pseudospiralis TaxID=6337 RepID=A0A0V1FD49_TRIPS|nr:hypothetical protein T4D_15914 [Trichinella pseudospiralis]